MNLGGFANVSFEHEGERIAYDICPVNIVLNRYANKIGLEYDDQGQIASSGTINIELLEALNSLDFYKINPPKSLGLEWVKEHVFHMIDSYNLDTASILRTFVEHIAIQISNELNGIQKSVLITGGGAFNSFLMERISELSEAKIIIPSNEIVEYKEALIFAFLGLLRLQNKVNVLCSVTGASENHSSGQIFIPNRT